MGHVARTRKLFVSGRVFLRVRDGTRSAQAPGPGRQVSDVKSRTSLSTIFTQGRRAMTEGCAHDQKKMNFTWIAASRAGAVTTATLSTLCVSQSLYIPACYTVTRQSASRAELPDTPTNLSHARLSVSVSCSQIVVRAPLRIPLQPPLLVRFTRPPAGRSAQSSCPQGRSRGARRRVHSCRPLRG